MCLCAHCARVYEFFLMQEKLVNTFCSMKEANKMITLKSKLTGCVCFVHGLEYILCVKQKPKLGVFPSFVLRTVELLFGLIYIVQFDWQNDATKNKTTATKTTRQKWSYTSF